MAKTFGPLEDIKNSLISSSQRNLETPTREEDQQIAGALGGSHDTKQTIHYGIKKSLPVGC